MRVRRKSASRRGGAQKKAQKSAVDLPIGQDGKPDFSVLDPVIRYRIEGDYWSGKRSQQRLHAREQKLIPRDAVERAVYAHAERRRRQILDLIPELAADIASGRLDADGIVRLLDKRFRQVYAIPPVPELQVQ